MPNEVLPTVLPGRECADCHVCCQVLTVDSPEFRKHGGCLCPHAREDASCGIYPDRFPICREFECGWRIFKWVRLSLRPDQSGVLISKFQDHAQGAREGIIINLLSEAALEADGLAETVAAAVGAGAPVMVGVPGPPGHTFGYVEATDALQQAVQTRDKPWLLDILRQARDCGLAVERQPVTLDAPGPD